MSKKLSTGDQYASGLGWVFVFLIGFTILISISNSIYSLFQLNLYSLFNLTANCATLGSSILSYCYPEFDLVINLIISSIILFILNIVYKKVKRKK
jgi:hypothetical protein